jgi:hypothetical protein
MTPEGITLLVGAAGSFLLVVGGGAKWLLSYINAKDIASALREAEARAELSKRMREEIDVLRTALIRAQAEKSLYLKRIYQLEYVIHKQPGLDLPAMEGWPPSDIS